jgi:hypothetical protein
MDASGQIAKTQVYASWKGIAYSRRYVVPSNPRSTDQTLTRNCFKFLNALYQVSPADFRAPWAEAVKGRALTDRNLFVQKNNGTMRTLNTLVGMIGSPAAKGGLPAPVVFTSSANSITATITPPTSLPAGWSVVKGIVAVVLEQDPQTDAEYDMVIGSDSSDPYAPVATGLAGTTDYVAAAWLVYQRSALATDLAYGPASFELKATT